MMEHNQDNILTNYENKVPIMAFSLENSINVRDRIPSDLKRLPDKMYHSDGYIFSFSVADVLPYHQVYKLLQDEVAKWLIDNQMVIGKFNITTKMVEFRLRYLHFKP